jgi:hypothetical protein
MSEPTKPEPDEDLLEFLGGIDELNDDSKGTDFSDFLANTDLEKVVAPARPPAKEGE